MSSERTLGENSKKWSTQLSLFTDEPFQPTAPSPNAAAGKVLMALVANNSITQLDWLSAGGGWRLAATIKELKYAGWNIQSNGLKTNKSKRPIASYQLSPLAREAAMQLLKVAHG